jgi:hypothetical protein
VKTRAAVLAVALIGATLCAQDSASQNVQTCLSGKYPALCNHSALTPEQLRQTIAAERTENLRVCMTGKYPALCDHSKLTTNEAADVRRAEIAENLRICETGKYRALCNHDWLSVEERTKAHASERAENLRVCLNGRFAQLCQHELLTADQRAAVAAAEAKAGSDRPHQAAAPPPKGSGPGGCETGHWIEAVADNGKIIKLEDGSLWEVDSVDTVTTSIWLPVTDVVVCGSKMINTDDNEVVDVRRIGGRGSSGTAARASYVIQAAANDETFVINGEVFKAKTYCFGFDKGDRVVFLEGSPLGACVSARFLNVNNNKVCSVWCE